MINKEELSKELKQIIIENYIDFYTSDDNERSDMKEVAFYYLEETHIDELEDYITKKQSI